MSTRMKQDNYLLALILLILMAIEVARAQGKFCSMAERANKPEMFEMCVLSGLNITH